MAMKRLNSIINRKKRQNREDINKRKVILADDKGEIFITDRTEDKNITGKMLKLKKRQRNK